MRKKVVCVFGDFEEDDFVLEPSCSDDCNCEICNKCSKDIQDFELQPMKNDNLKILLEVFLRRGKGEEITFKQIHLEKSRFKFFNFMDVWKESNSSKTGKEKQ